MKTRSSEPGLSRVPPGQHHEAFVVEQLLEIPGHLRPHPVQLLVGIEEVWQDQDHHRPNQHAHPRHRDDAAVELPHTHLSNEVTLIALSATRIKTQLQPTVGLLFERLLPGVEDLHPRRAGRCKRCDAKGDRLFRAAARDASWEAHEDDGQEDDEKEISVHGKGYTRTWLRSSRAPTLRPPGDQLEHPLEHRRVSRDGLPQVFPVS